MKTTVLSGQACLLIVRGRLVRTARYRAYKAKIATHVATQMMLDGARCAPRGTMYGVQIIFSCKGWGVDADNAAKAILDALIGVCIDDDRGVVELEIKKQTHSKDESLAIKVTKIGFREVPPPAKKRASNPDAPSRAGKIRPRRTKAVGGNGRYKRKVKG